MYFSLQLSIWSLSLYFDSIFFICFYSLSSTTISIIKRLWKLTYIFYNNAIEKFQTHYSSIRYHFFWMYFDFAFHFENKFVSIFEQFSLFSQILQNLNFSCEISSKWHDSTSTKIQTINCRIWMLMMINFCNLHHEFLTMHKTIF